MLIIINKESMKKQLIFSLSLVLAVTFFNSCKKEKGCTDKNATNYNEDADEDDGSCTFTTVNDSIDSNDSNTNDGSDNGGDVVATATIIGKWELVDSKTETFISGSLHSVNESKNITNTTIEYKSNGDFVNKYDYDSETKTISTGGVTSVPRKGETNGTYEYKEASNTVEQTAFGFTTTYEVEFTLTTLKLTTTSVNGTVRSVTVSNYKK